jgi:hypothetical protein
VLVLPPLLQQIAQHLLNAGNDLKNKGTGASTPNGNPHG